MADLLLVALAHGLILFIIVMVVGKVSGAHVNPAVTIGLASVGRFPSAAPSAASIEGKTTPGLYPASRKTDSYSSITLASATAATTRTPSGNFSA